jgi:hypothetical protein
VTTVTVTIVKKDIHPYTPGLAIRAYACSPIPGLTGFAKNLQFNGTNASLKLSIE